MKRTRSDLVRITPNLTQQYPGFRESTEWVPERSRQWTLVDARTTELRQANQQTKERKAPETTVQISFVEGR